MTGSLTCRRGARWLALAAGALDGATGLGLVLAPALMVRLMRVAPVQGDAAVMLRWVGAFVASVGGMYLWAWWRGGALLPAMLELTVLPRLAAGLFSTTAIALGWLGWAWLSVPVTDLALAGAQVWILGRLREHA